MDYSRDDVGATRIATLDIETTGFDATAEETVAIGLGLHERGTPGSDASLDCFYREAPDDEGEMILGAAERLADYGADLLLTYNGADFDLPFLRDRLDELGVTQTAFQFAEDDHLDLLTDRKAMPGKWPKLEECVAAYGATPARTVWNGTVVDGGVFGEELAPAYLRGLAADDSARTSTLRPVIEHYLESDLENNWLVYYGDLGVDFEPESAGTVREFST
jgi:hypothetical protein